MSNNKPDAPSSQKTLLNPNAKSFMPHNPNTKSFMPLSQNVANYAHESSKRDDSNQRNTPDLDVAKKEAKKEVRVIRQRNATLERFVPLMGLAIVRYLLPTEKELDFLAKSKECHDNLCSKKPSSNADKNAWLRPLSDYINEAICLFETRLVDNVQKVRVQIAIAMIQAKMEDGGVLGALLSLMRLFSDCLMERLEPDRRKRSSKFYILEFLLNAQLDDLGNSLTVFMDPRLPRQIERERKNRDANFQNNHAYTKK
jgi:hypothetical protein